jgi:hypothetical protein
MDLDPETAERLRMLRRLTNGQRNDEELLAQLRAEQQSQESPSSDRKKRWRWLGS